MNHKHEMPAQLIPMEECAGKEHNEISREARELKEKFEKTSAYGRIKFANELSDFVGGLRAKYGNEELDRREFCHIVSSSGYAGDWNSQDFEGDDSIKAFIDEKYDYYKEHPVPRKKRPENI